MKKLSLFLMALVAVTTMNATVVTFDFTNPTSLGIVPSAKASDGVQIGGTSYTKEDVTLTFAAAQSNGSKEWTNSNGTYELRFYQPNAFTLSSATDNITMVQFSFSDKGGIVAVSGELDGNTWTGDAKEVSFQNPAQGKVSKIKTITVTYGEKPVVWEPDTITVTEAIQLIKAKDPKMNNTHYVVGVVNGSAFEPISKKYAAWLVDTVNSKDSLEAFCMKKNATTEYASVEEMAADFGLNDTVMIFADALALYGTDVYETTSGYFVETVGKSSTVDVTETYKYGVGAFATDSEKEEQYAYEIVLSSVGPEDTNNAVHMFIGTYLEKSIEGSYSLFDDKSYVDNVGPISGSLKLTFVSTDGTNNTYHIVANYAADGKTYRIDGNYVLPGYTKDFEPYFFENDTYYPAEDGETLTCLQALRFARSLGGEGIESAIKVSIKGFVAAKPVIKKVGQINFDMKDDLNGKAYAQAFYCYEQDLDSILAGDEVLVTGKVQLYGGKAEISNGTITRLNDGPKHYRDLQCVEIPDGYISVERAMEIGNALQAEVGKTVETDEAYTVVGYVAKVTYQMSNDTASWFMSDDKESTFGDLQAYKCHIEFLLAHGDRVMITGKIAKYQKDATTANIEFAKGTAQIINPCTDLEEVFMQAEKLRINKILIDGQLLIQKDNKWYNAQGAVIKQ